MIKLTAKQIAEITGGTLVNGDPESDVCGYSIDSRSTEKGDLFLPLKGGNCDGHDFIKDAVKKGAVGYLTTQDYVNNGVFSIKVDNILEALHRLAIDRRKKFNGKVVAITGSTGKTTTRDFLKSILGRSRKVFSSPANYNTEIGLPLTLLRFPDESEVLVLEMGMRGEGQIKLLSDIASPDYGVITNISQTHIELLGSEENIAKAKGELLQALGKEKMAFLRSGDKWTPYLKSLCNCNTRTFGLKDADFIASDITLDNMARPSFVMTSKYLKTKVKLQIPGKHNIFNATAASAVAIEMGSSVEDITMGLSEAKVTGWRMEVKENGENLILCDYYNASPLSMGAALETLANINSSGRKIAILGDMLELGEISAHEHKKIIQKALDITDLVLVVGRKMAEAVEETGNNIRAFSNINELAQILDQYIKSGDVILLKASRAMAFESLEDKLMGEKIAT